MTLDPKKNKNTLNPNVKPIKTNKQLTTQPNEEFNSAITKLTKENYELLKKLTGSGFVQIHKK